ncbi:MAG: class I SAM-dependent methyltransferase [Desulfobacteraceae bacterium]|nr:class I SAM-dependent methyltransferase [Desulfobacteraceae bacterium]
MQSFDNTWDLVHQNKNWGVYPNESIISKVKRLFPTGTGLKAIDLGCGRGANTQFLIRENFSTTAIDGSKSSVKKTKSYLDSQELKANVIVQDFTDLKDIESDQFDLAIDCRSLIAQGT